MADLKRRFFNHSWHTFRTKNLQTDAVYFLLDLVFEKHAVFARQKWLGVNFQQDPFDAVAIQHLLYTIKPDLVVETGTHQGGGALFYSTILSAVHPGGRVITMDPWKSLMAYSRQGWSAVVSELFDRHVTYLNTSSLKPWVVAHVKSLASKSARTLVVLDSSHDGEHVLHELNAYAECATVGSYVIVEDTKMDRIFRSKDLSISRSQQWFSPADAVDAFLDVNQGVFRRDRTPESMGYSQHVRGYLKRVSASAVTPADTMRVRATLRKSSRVLPLSYRPQDEVVA